MFSAIIKSPCFVGFAVFCFVRFFPSFLDDFGIAFVYPLNVLNLTLCINFASALNLYYMLAFTFQVFSLLVSCHKSLSSCSEVSYGSI